MEVVRRQLGYPQDGLLTLLFDCSHVILLLRLLHQRLLKTGDHLTLRVDVLGKGNKQKSHIHVTMDTSIFNPIFFPLSTSDVGDIFNVSSICSDFSLI